MSISMDAEALLKKIDEYTANLSELLKKRYAEGEEELKKTDTSVKNFISSLLSDKENKLREYQNSVNPPTFVVAGYEKSEEEKQQEYVSKIRAMLNHLDAFGDEIKLSIETKKKSTKLDEIEQKTYEVKAEAERRAAVTDTKSFGAAIEIIDALRDELKSRESTSQELIEIKKTLLEIQRSLTELRKELSSASSATAPPKIMLTFVDEYKKLDEITNYLSSRLARSSRMITKNEVESSYSEFKFVFGRLQSKIVGLKSEKVISSQLSQCDYIFRGIISGMSIVSSSEVNKLLQELKHLGGLIKEPL